MLYIFEVIRGIMHSYDFEPGDGSNLIFTNIKHIKSLLENDTCIQRDQQVLLISGGYLVLDEDKICELGAGTDDNPIFLFSTNLLNLNELESEVSLCEQHVFEREIRHCLNEKPSVNCVKYRYEIMCGIREDIYILSNECDSLLRDQHLQLKEIGSSWGSLKGGIDSCLGLVETMTSELEDDVELKEEKDVLLVVKQLKSQKFPKSVREALSLDESFENAFDLISSHFKSTTEIDLTEYLKLSDSGTFSKCLKECYIRFYGATSKHNFVFLSPFDYVSAPVKRIIESNVFNNRTAYTE
ncbi:hypothetical protein ACOME3_008181 [Neoechinorhynchus agilis]